MSLGTFCFYRIVRSRDTRDSISRFCQCFSQLSLRSRRVKKKFSTTAFGSLLQIVSILCLRRGAKNLAKKFNSQGSWYLVSQALTRRILNFEKQLYKTPHFTLPMKQMKSKPYSRPRFYSHLNMTVLCRLMGLQIRLGWKIIFL